MTRFRTIKPYFLKYKKNNLIFCARIWNMFEISNITAKTNLLSTIFYNYQQSVNFWQLFRNKILHCVTVDGDG